MSGRPVTRWLFGKLPAQGDFVSRGIDHGLRDALDHWLSGELRAAAARFGDEFESRYFAAPAWHFVDRDAQGQWSGGALCASVDAVGRKFPVMIAAPAENAREAAAVAGGCLDILHAGFAEGWDADGLHSAPLAAAPPAWQPDAPGWALIGEAGEAVVIEGRFPPRVVERMLELAA